MNRESVEHYEKLIRQNINNSDLPFLGLFIDSLDDQLIKSLKAILEEGNDPILGILKSLVTFPALFSMYIIYHLANEFGIRGCFEVYPILSKALSKRLTNSDKELLWKAFRRACLRLGLQVSHRTSGPHYMVDEYLRQVGIPLRYIEELTRKMISYGEKVGYPEEDDPDSIQLWRQGLIENLNIPFPKTAKNAFEMDETGYYVLLFLKVFKKDIRISGSEIEKRMLATISNFTPESQRRQRLQIPRIIFQDSRVGIQLPPCENIVQKRWTIEVDGEEIYYLSKRDEQFVPVDATLPRHMTIKDNDTAIVRNYPLWIDDLDNRFIIFSSKGFFVKTYSMTEAEAFIDPGEYQILLRFCPEGFDNVEFIHGDRERYLLPISLKPGEIFLLHRGPVIFKLRADNKILIKWQGTPIKDIHGKEIYLSKELIIQIIIPTEIVKESESRFLLCLNTGGVGDLIELTINRNNEIIIVLDDYCRKWKPGVCRLLAEIHLMGSKRVLSRSAIYLWNGLIDVKDRIIFHCNKIPKNINREKSENIDIFEDKSITYKNVANRFFKMVFDLEPSGHIIFSWAVPGIFLYLEEFDSYGIMQEKSVRKSSCIPVNEKSRQNLKLYTTYSGKIELGSFYRYINVSQTGCVRIPLVSLLEYLEPDDNTLYFVSDREKIALLDLIAPHQALDFNLFKEGNIIVCNFLLKENIEGFRVTAKDLSNDVEINVDLQPFSPIQNLKEGGGVRIEKEFDEDKEAYKYSIYLYLETWGRGLWLINFRIQLFGRLEVLVNLVNELYSIGFILKDIGMHGSLAEFLYKFQTAFSSERLLLFRRVHEALLNKYDERAWHEISWLAKLWKKLAKTFHEQDESVFNELLNMLTLKIRALSSENWIPVFNVGIALPHIFSKAIKSYADISIDNLLLKSFSACSGLGKNWHNVFIKWDFDPAVLGGFTNMSEISQKKAMPGNFKMELYKEALKARDISEDWKWLSREDWQPGKGYYLGPLHYRYVIKNLIENYTNSFSKYMGTKGKALMLARNIPLDIIDSVIPASNLYGDRYINPFILDEFSVDSYIEKEHLCNLIRFISIFAQACRWDARSSGNVDRLYNFFLLSQQNNISKQEQDKMKALSYILYIGEDVFAFYIMLWELIFSAIDHQWKR